MLNYLKKQRGFVCAYHSTSTNIPSESSYGLHNVVPEVVCQQIKWLKCHYEIITIDEWFATEDKTGKAAITFDDGYCSVFKETLPALLELKVPLTMFLCGRMLEGGIFWRDKIRYLLASELTDDFCDFVVREDMLNSGDFRDNIFLKTRDPDIDSALLDKALDAFLTERRLIPDLKKLPHVFLKADQLIRHPLVTYGNHTYNHYVLSSLDSERQRDEIERMENLLNSLDIPRSKVFCLPFGHCQDANADTFDICVETGFAGILYCSDVMRPMVNTDTYNQLPAVDRLLMSSNLRIFGRFGVLYSLFD